MVMGLATWRFISLDPATMLPTEDPLAGFLPPNLNPPEGQGSVLYTVKPKQGLPTGTEIRNQASIVFDTNAPILTPEWFNTLDNTTPDSTVLPLAATQNTASFEVHWSGNDVGAGIQDYPIYVSENGGPFTVWQRDTPNTSGTFSGVNGKTYAFYSVARDQAGNVEGHPAVADTETHISESLLLCHGRAVTILGTEEDDVLEGTPGDDVIMGLGGNDRINGKAGNDVICGGSGDDIIRGGTGDDWIDGGPGEDRLFGGPGNDVLHGSAGNDVLDGGADHDICRGHRGDDTFTQCERILTDAVLLEPTAAACEDLTVTFRWRIEEPEKNVVYCSEVWLDKGRNPFDGNIEEAFHAGKAKTLTVSLDANRYDPARVEWGVNVTACKSREASCPCRGHEFTSNIRTLRLSASAPNCP